MKNREAPFQRVLRLYREHGEVPDGVFCLTPKSWIRQRLVRDRRKLRQIFMSKKVPNGSVIASDIKFYYGLEGDNVKDILRDFLRVYSQTIEELRK
jgi:hypothetical protein